jgi:predicted ATPase
MKLERIKIEGYRSLKSVEWKPSALNVLIGANASGKSNFLQALELLPAAAEGRLERKVLDSGGIAPMLWNGQASKIRLLPEFGEAHYSLVLHRVAKTGAFEVTEEKLVDRDDQVILDRTWSDLAEAVKRSDTILASRLDRDEHTAPLAVQQALADWSIYQDLRTDQQAPVRESAVTGYAKRLERDGQNLIPVLHTLYTGDRGFEEDVDRVLAVAFPGEYEKLSFQAVPERGRITMAVRWKRGSWQPTAADLSDGTLRFLMLVAILISPDPPPLLAIDEPETGLHPNMLCLVAELAQQAATKSQVVLSTHSPEFLDAFGQDDLPATTVFQWEGDRTELRTIYGDELRKWVEDYSLGRFAFSGEAEAVS